MRPLPPPHRPKPPATDAMTCRSCGREERASEGYPCAQCGTFICLICSFRGVTLCRACGGGADRAPTAIPAPPTSPPPPAS